MRAAIGRPAADDRLHPGRCGYDGANREQRHVRNAVELGHSLDLVDFRESTPLRAGQVDDTPYGGGAGMVIRVDVIEAALRERYGVDPVERRTTGWSPPRTAEASK